MKRDELYKLHENDTDTEKLINIILRSYTGLFTDYAYINEDSLVIRSGLTRQRIYEILLALTRRHIIHYIPRKKTPYIIYTRERQEKESPCPNPGNIRRPEKKAIPPESRL